ncbi:hypothetical protein PoB_005562600 [Plakobranchus ocellatus]|uniref:Uncharacterized protein n=1 Tax=Plakobranchus ocellatus TaxID=259542 RepID=A0AAV4C8S7_9GAST|nr:hypothetical protein PoB_005562600 [Plakobranchus ocellatus]
MCSPSTRLPPTTKPWDIVFYILLTQDSSDRHRTEVPRIQCIATKHIFIAPQQHCDHAKRPPVNRKLSEPFTHNTRLLYLASAWNSLQSSNDDLKHSSLEYWRHFSANSQQSESRSVPCT